MALTAILITGVLNLRFGLKINGILVLASALMFGAVIGVTFPKVGHFGFHVLEGVLSNIG